MKRILPILLLLLTIGCKPITQIVEKPVYITQKEYINNVIVDSIYIKDSTDRYKSNDTVWITKFKYKYVYKMINDTVIVTDSFPVTIKETIIKEVNKLRWWQKALVYIGIASITFFIIWLIVKLKK